MLFRLYFHNSCNSYTDTVHIKYYKFLYLYTYIYKNCEKYDIYTVYYNNLKR